MENGVTLDKDFGLVPCGQKNIDVLKIDNTSNNIHTLVVTCKGGNTEVSNERLHIHPNQALVLPGQSARFTLTYLSFLEDIVDNFYCYVLENEKLVARVNVRAQSVGPLLSPLVYNLRFFHFRNVSQTVKRIEITNTVKCEAKFYFDLDEDYQHLEISQTRGVIPAGLKFGLTFTFKPAEPEVYYKKIFCIVQFHRPIIFNILGVYKPKLKLDLKNLKFRFPPEENFPDSYAAYMSKVIPVKVPEEDKTQFYLKCTEENDTPVSEAEEEQESEKKRWSIPLDSVSELENQPNENISPEVTLTNSFLDIKNSSETLKATTLINFSKTQLYYFEWDHDPKSHFRIDPCNGFIDPNMKIHFTIYFTPSALDFLYHIEVDLKVFPCSNEPEESPKQIINLPLTMSLKIIGHSFPDDSCGWVPQCRINRKSLHLRSCVPGEVVYGTFMIERQGHLPVTFAVIPPEDSNYAVQPVLGYLSKNFQLFVVQFSSESKEQGVYTEDIKIKFNNSNTNCETIKLAVSVEIPQLIFGKDNSLTFTPIFPGSKASSIVPIENPTNLYLMYEFVVPDDIQWAEIVNPKGWIEPNSFGEVEIVFKPPTPCEYLDYIPCYISSISKPDCIVTIHFQLIGSCQFGYLVATPSSHDFGESLYLEEKSIIINLFNFSSSLLHFQLTTVHRAFPVGDPQKDVVIAPNRGSVPAKGSLEVKVTIIPHNKDIIQYAIECQNLEGNSIEALPQDEPRKIFLLRFQGVLPSMKVIDLNVINGGPLFSSHWLWKMMNIDRLNKALESLSLAEEVFVKFPETVLGSDQITIGLLLEANKYGDIKWRFRQQTACPCLEASDIDMSENLQCKLVTDVGVDITQTLGANKRVMLEMILKYEALSECIFEWTIELPYSKKVTLKALIVSSPSNDIPLTSMYLRPHFNLKPVYIGDIHPPVQLFWLYNNTRQPTSYIVESITLKEAKAKPQQIFDCINPKGVIPPISSIPLKFFFRPTELKTYSAEVQMCMNGNERKTLHLTGEGIAHFQYVKEFSMSQTLPKKSIIKNVEADLECSTNFINISHFRMFSVVIRIFYLRNRSKSESWTFRWHTFKIPDIISAKVEPTEGVIPPKSSAIMKVTLQSYSYPTFISISIPCDVINYSKLKAYESSIRYREMMTEKAKDYFIITEKGEHSEEPNIPLKEKPKLAHIFITVNTNIINTLSLDQKMSQNQQLNLKAGIEILHNFETKSELKSSQLPSIQRIMENLLWQVLNSNIIKEKIKRLEESQDYNYLQILPESKKKCEENSRRFLLLPSKIKVQILCQKALKEIICKNFGAEKKLDCT